MGVTSRATAGIERKNTIEINTRQESTSNLLERKTDELYFRTEGEGEGVSVLPWQPAGRVLRGTFLACGNPFLYHSEKPTRALGLTRRKGGKSSPESEK